MGLDVGVDLSANVITSAALELAKVVRLWLEKQPNYNQKQLEAFYEFQKRRAQERSRPDRDLSDLTYWVELEQLFVDTLFREITPKS